MLVKIQNLISGRVDKKIRVKTDEETIFVWPFYNQKLYALNIIFELEKNAKCTNIFLFSADENDEYNLNVAVNHKGANSTSETLIRGIAKNRSKVSVFVRASIEKEAEHTRAWLDGRVLLLDEAAGRIDPRLEILTSEVERAGHAATVSRIAEDELFYMETRGVDEADAKRLKSEGFLLAPLLQIGLNFDRARKIIKPLLI